MTQNESIDPLSAYHTQDEQSTTIDKILYNNHVSTNSAPSQSCE